MSKRVAGIRECIRCMVIGEHGSGQAYCQECTLKSRPSGLRMCSKCGLESDHGRGQTACKKCKAEGARAYYNPVTVVLPAPVSEIGGPNCRCGAEKSLKSKQCVSCYLERVGLA